jgi:hypothetical protein
VENTVLAGFVQVFLAWGVFFLVGRYVGYVLCFGGLLVFGVARGQIPYHNDVCKKCGNYVIISWNDVTLGGKENHIFV